MKTIKFIDLLNKIANGEKVPKKIKIGNILAIFNENIKQYETGEPEEYYTDLLFISPVNLNDEIEIIEDTPTAKTEEDYMKNIQEYQKTKHQIEDKKIEKLVGESEGININYSKINIIDKINEIIDKVNGE